MKVILALNALILTSCFINFVFRNYRTKNKRISIRFLFIKNFQTHLHIMTYNKYHNTYFSIAPKTFLQPFFKTHVLKCQKS